MRVVIGAIGRLKKGGEADLCERYRKRALQAGRAIGLRDIDITEIKESRAPDAAKRMMEESIALATIIPERAMVVLLDEKGENLSSAAIAQQIGTWRDHGVPALVFIVGGPDGLAPSLCDKAKLTIAFGAATWPHQLVRVLLLEQIYRAVTILSGHPYHRS